MKTKKPKVSYKRRIKEQETQLAAAKFAQVSMFYGDEIPTFSQGEPTHELQELVTAEHCIAMVKMIKHLRDQVLGLGGVPDDPEKVV